ncbi:hypothetical protein EV138_4263 [Kribbella voronezhensis]|uniref:Uncharacterized protein n=1 Tax=Kribbella voronezhensis TaxID=2512212 RepID=A0A4R7TEP6_9ACTN|nr:hypothetical protein [Kribbella voronezhensis]TDU90671.1 hypothetical protein EV138_4263 [Kribbella voronezhensis]
MTQLKARARTSAVAALAAVTIVTGSAFAAAQPLEPLNWTPTPTRSGPSVINDIDAKPAGTWAVGSDLVDDFMVQRPFILHWVGGQWKKTPQPMHTNSALQRIAVAGANDVWAVGEDRADPEQPKPLVMHWNGTAWKVVPAPAVPTGSFDEVKIGPDGTPWVTGWARIGTEEPAVVYRYVAGKWQALNTGLEGAINGNTLTVISRNDAWIGMNPGLAHFDGKSWKLVDALPEDGSKIPTALAAAGPKDIWLVGVGHKGGPEGETPLAMHYDGVSWKSVPTPSGSAQLYDVALWKGRPVAGGESFTSSGNIITSHPYVLDYRGGRFVKAKSPVTGSGTVATVSAANGRLWVGGLIAATPTSQYAAFAAFTR